MVAILNRSEQAEQRIVLYHVRWETYERLLEDLADSSAPRLAFDQGTLEIMSPTAEHEECNRTLALLVEVVAEEMSIDVRCFGSTTFKRQDLRTGFEPDSSFYIQSSERIRGKKRLDLTQDPPPDLVIEIDITNPSRERFNIFAQVGVPEIWRYDGKGVQIFTLIDEKYAEVERSIVLPLLTNHILTGFLNDSLQTRRPLWLRRLRQWLRSQIGVGH